MDAYTKTWLQFLFPVYIWVMIALIIFASSKWHRLFKVPSNNPIAVLATLFLLSYTKFLRTVIATLSLTTLDYPSDVRRNVWLLEGNIRYLTGKHVVSLKYEVSYVK